MKSILPFSQEENAFHSPYSYWERQSEYTPESRIETHESMKKKRERETNEYVLKILQFHLLKSVKNKT